MKNKIVMLVASTILSVCAPSMATAQTQTTPHFRVPLGSAPTQSDVTATYAWLQQVGNCSTTCGSGTRTTTHQCQNVADYDFASGGYGLPEADSMCTSSVGARPADSGSSCTVYSGCGYDWVKPPVAQTPKALDPYPVGRVGCGLVNQVFSPYCQRTGGGTNVILSAGDYRFCSSDRPDYDEVASGNADALGFNRDVTQVSSCNTTDHKWTQSGFGSWSSSCSTNAVRTQTVTCERKFDGRTYPNSAAEDAACGASSRPPSSETSAQYGSCSYSYRYSTWSAWSSGCSDSATRTRTAQCLRDVDGGMPVTEAECTSRNVTKQGLSESGAQYGSCTYSWIPGDSTSSWGPSSNTCSGNATQTRSVICRRDGTGATVGDSLCTGAKPATSRTIADYSGCSYNWEPGAAQTGTGWGTPSGSPTATCSASVTQTRSVICRRSNGDVVADSQCASAGARPASSRTYSDYSGCSYARGAYQGASGWSSGCSPNAQRTHTYACQRQDGTVVSSGECTNRGVSVSDVETAPIYSSCSHSWAQGGFGGWSSGCSATATRTQAVWCRRDIDGATVADSNCNAAARPASSQTSAQYGSCSYARGAYQGSSAWSSSCSPSAQRTHTYACQRQDGTPVAAAECTNRGVSVSDVETAANYTGCTYRIEDAGVGACQSSNQAPHYWRCIRNQDGAQVDSSTFCGRPNPTYEACSYYTYRIEDAGVGACQSNNQAPHYWRCIRNQDGAQVDSATYCGRSNPTYDSCTYATYNWYQGGYGGWSSTCSTTATRTQTVFCRRDQDGAQVADSACTGARPQSSQVQTDYSGCGYSPVYGSYSACSGGQQTASLVGCTRSLDNASVPLSECTNRGSGSTQSKTCQASCRWGTALGNDSSGFNLQTLGDRGAQAAASNYSYGSYYVDNIGNSQFVPGDVGSSWFGYGIVPQNYAWYKIDNVPRRSIWLFCQYSGQGQGGTSYRCQFMGSRAESCS